MVRSFTICKSLLLVCFALMLFTHPANASNKPFKNFPPCPAGGNGPPTTVASGPNGSITVQCVNGAYQVIWHPKNGKPVFIGRCAYDWGENDGRFCVDAKGNITMTCWNNEEGHTNHMTQVHDDNTHGQFPGKYERDQYCYTPGTNMLIVIKWKKMIVKGKETGNWMKCKVTYSGAAPTTYADLVTQTASANSLQDGVDNAITFTWSTISGIAQPGTITLNILDSVYTITLTGGETAASIATQLASMISSDPANADPGISAYTIVPDTGDGLQINAVNVLDEEIYYMTTGQDGGGLTVTVPSSAPPVDPVTNISLLTSISGTLLLEGSDSSAMPRMVTYEFRPQDGSTPITTVGVVNGDGTFMVRAVVNGASDLFIKTDQYLAESVFVDTSNGSITGLTVDQLPGDGNNDNQVDGADFSILVSNYGNTVFGDPGIGAPGDFNGDGLIDLADFGLLVTSYGLSGAQ